MARAIVKSHSSSSIGSVKQSMLDEATFQSIHGTGWVLMDGRDLSVTNPGSAYQTLTGQSVLPDARGQFLRSKVNLDTISGDGLASDSVLDQATFNSHGINRTGFKIKLQSGTLSGLNTSTEYYAIVVDENTLAFATSLANAQSDTRVGISGTNSAILVQYENPDGDVALGTHCTDKFGNHRHEGTYAVHFPQGSGGSTHRVWEIYYNGNNNFGGHNSTYGWVRPEGGNETAPKNVTVNTFIKINE